MNKVKRAMMSDAGIRLIAFLLILFVFSLFNPTILSMINIFSILNNACFIGILAMGMTIVMITGNLDLSLVSIGLLSGYVTIMILQATGLQNGGMYLMFPIAAVAGGLCGLINGFFVYRFDIRGIIVSLGMAQIYSGIMFVVFGTSFFPSLPAGMSQLGRTFLFEIDTSLGKARVSLSVLILLLAVLLVWFVLNKTMVGRGIYAIGGDKTAARRVGINMPLAYSVAYGIMGVLAGMAGVMYYANNTLFQSDWILLEQGDALAATIFGGVILKDGKGTVGGVVMGVLIIGLITNNLYLIGIPAYGQKIVVGILMLVSIILSSMDRFGRRSKSGNARKV